MSSRVSPFKRFAPTPPASFNPNFVARRSPPFGRLLSAVPRYRVRLRQTEPRTSGVRGSPPESVLPTFLRRQRPLAAPQTNIFPTVAAPLHSQGLEPPPPVGVLVTSQKTYAVRRSGSINRRQSGHQRSPTGDRSRGTDGREGPHHRRKRHG